MPGLNSVFLGKGVQGEVCRVRFNGDMKAMKMTDEGTITDNNLRLYLQSFFGINFREGKLQDRFTVSLNPNSARLILSNVNHDDFFVRANNISQLRIIKEAAFYCLINGLTTPSEQPVIQSEQILVFQRQRNDKFSVGFLFDELPGATNYSEYLETQELQSIHSNVNFHSLLKIVTQLESIAQLLDRMANGGFLHRDFKFTNILVSNDRLFLIDFGLIIFNNSTSGLRNFSVGTPYYQSPESAVKNYYTSTDLMSLGLSIIRLLSPNLLERWRFNDIGECLRYVYNQENLRDEVLNNAILLYDLEVKFGLTPEDSSRVTKLLSLMVLKAPEKRIFSAHAAMQLFQDLLKKPFDLTKYNMAKLVIDYISKERFGISDSNSNLRNQLPDSTDLKLYIANLANVKRFGLGVDVNNFAREYLLQEHSRITDYYPKNNE